MSFLGKRRPSSPRRASEIRLHRGGEGHLSRAGAVPDPGGIPRRLLRVAHAAPGAPDPAGSAARRRDSGDSRRDPPALWQSARARRAPGARAAGGLQAGRPLDACAGALRPPAAPVSDHDRLQSSSGGGPQRAGPALHRPRARHGVGHRHHLSLDPRRAGCTWLSFSISSRAPSWAGP